MKIFLTGATGFLGTYFLKEAVSKGHTVIATKHKSPPSFTSQKVIWLEKSIEKVEYNDLKGCDVLVHLAAHTANVPYDSLRICMQWNLMAVLKLFDQAFEAGITRYIVAGSCFEYGRSAYDFEEIPNNAPLIPTNSYAASKAAASIALQQWATELEVSLEILRVFHAYGEGEPKNRLWPSLRKAALDGSDFPMSFGDQIRDFQPVKTVASAFLSRTTDSTFSNGCLIQNLGTGKPTSIKEFAQTWWNYWNAPGKLLLGSLPYRKHDIMRYVPKVDIFI